VAAALVAVQGWRRGLLAPAFLGVHPLVIIAGVLMNKTIADFHAGRYLVLAVADLAACLALAPAVLRRPAPQGRAGRRRDVVAAALPALAAAGTVVALVSAAVDAPMDVAVLGGQQREQQETLTMLDRAADAGARTGLAPFWTADLATALTGGRVQASDVTCDAGRLRLRFWITDTARLRALGSRTFVLLPGTKELGGCSPAAVVAQMGRQPVLRLGSQGGTVLLVFDGDVTQRVLPGRLPS
jgi:hypothetical protein